MPKPLKFARYCALLSGTLVLCMALCVPPARAQFKPADPNNPQIQADLNAVPVFAALDLLIKSTGRQYRFTPEALRNRINAQQKIDLEVKGTLQQGLLELLKQVEPPLLFHVENGVYVFEADPKPRAPYVPPKSDLPPGPIGMSLGNVPFDEAVQSLFRAAQTRYRIDPAVTAYLEPVTFKVKGTTLDAALNRLLNSVEGLQTPLTFRVENGVYVIVPKPGAEKSALPPATDKPKVIYLRDPGPPVKDAMFTNTPVALALKLLFEQTQTNYVLTLPAKYAAKLTLSLHNLPLEQAVARVLRSAPPDPMLHLRIVDNTYFVTSGEMLSGAAPAQTSDNHLFFRFKNIGLYEALRALLRNARYNYFLDPAWNMWKVTVTADNLPFEEALQKLLAAAPKPLTYKIADNTLVLMPK